MRQTRIEIGQRLGARLGHRQNVKGAVRTEPAHRRPGVAVREIGDEQHHGDMDDAAEKDAAEDIEERADHRQLPRMIAGSTASPTPLLVSGVS